jgi:putative ABC transport system permease protein
MRTTIVGIGMGLISAFWLGEYVASLLFGVSPADAATFAGIPVILVGVAFVACMVPDFACDACGPGGCVKGRVGADD